MTEDIKAGSKLLTEFEGYETKEGKSGTLYRLSKRVNFNRVTWEKTAYHTDYNELMRVWRKFREWKFDLYDLNNLSEFEKSDKHAGWQLRIKIAFMYEDTPEPAFKELVSAITWLKSI